MRIEVTKHRSIVRVSRRTRLRAWWRRRRLGPAAWAIVREVEARIDHEILFGSDA